jgi:hypothetical protein
MAICISNLQLQKLSATPSDSAIEIRKLKVWDAIGDLDIDYFSARFINAAIINRILERKGVIQLLEIV